MFQNLLYFMYILKTHLVFPLWMPWSIVLINIDQGILKGKSKVARNEKKPKNYAWYHGFLYIKYRKFCSILLGNLVVSNPHISEEWDDNKIFQKNFFFGNFLIIIFMSHFWWILIYQCHIVVDNASLQKKVISDDEFLITCWRFLCLFSFCLC